MGFEPSPDCSGCKALDYNTAPQHLQIHKPCPQTWFVVWCDVVWCGVVWICGLWICGLWICGLWFVDLGHVVATWSMTVAMSRVALVGSLISCLQLKSSYKLEMCFALLSNV